ncbi:MAG: SpoIIE family protein phosphatase [Opitutales bacterium]
MEDPDFPAGLDRRGMLQQLMDHLSDNIYFMDQEGRIILISQWGARWLGFDSPEEVVGKTDHDLFTAEHAEAASADEQRIIRTGEPVTGIEEKETWSDGRETWVSTTKMPLRDDGGNIVGIFGISRDITAHKKREILINEMKEQMESELERASEVQRSFLGQRSVRFPERGPVASGSLRVVHEYRPSGPVGGDFFCLLPLSETRVGIFVADVMGHGVGAALTMSALNAIVRSEATRAPNPEVLLQRLNRRLRDVLSRKDAFEFITAFYLVFDTADGRMVYSTAGHHSPLVQRAGAPGAERLFHDGRLRGPALMLLGDAVFSTGEGLLAPGDRLFLFTDGLIEMPAAASGGPDLGIDGLARIVAREAAKDNGLAALVGRLTTGVLELSGATRYEDDVCLIGLEFEAPEEPA